MTEGSDLARRAESVAEATEQAIAWTLDPANAGAVGSEAKSLGTSLRRKARRARRLARAAGGNMAVSVFGPSQAGKSFLVSVLARPKDGALVADFPGPDGRLDYISEINPEGEGESTGVVTRFTMTKASAPDGFPIALKLLGEADVIRVIVNSFFMDGDENGEESPSAESLDARVSAAEKRAAAGGGGPGLSEDDVLDVRDYVESNFRSLAYAASLRGFWDDAARLAPKLSVADRGELLSALWGGHEPLTAIYVRLAAARADLGDGDTVHVGLDALRPRDTSIIDVKTLKGLYGKGDELSAMPADGRPRAVERAALCALAAELVLPMRDKPWDMFDGTDLLDFPGARNRFKAPLESTLAEPEKNVPELLLRGKVAYLFDRYVADQEITAMLLCIPDSNMEAIDLPRLVEEWIELTHGATPQERLAAECILFFVLTKFDKHLGESAADGGPSSRFQRRMESSFEKFWRHSDSWPRQWTPDKPFTNCFWLRNPNYFVKGLIEYDEEDREIGYVGKEKARLEELREGCLAAEAVRTHFADPAEAWDAAMKLNDGGVGHLVAALEKACRPETRTRQIAAQLDSVVRAIVESIDPFHFSGDLEVRIEEKRAAAEKIVEAMEGASRSGLYGRVRGALCVDADEIADRIARIPGNVHISSRAGPDDGTGSAADGEMRKMTREGFQAASALNVWFEGMHRFAENAAIEKLFGISSANAKILVAEISHAERRCGLRERMIEGLAKANFALTVRQQSGSASLICAEAINSFAERLGVAPPPEDASPVAFDADALSEEPAPFADENLKAWSGALMRMFEMNARDVDGESRDVEQNLRLGAILKTLREGSEAR